MPDDAPSHYNADSYASQSRLPLNCLLFLAPLLLFFHIGAAWYGAGSLLALRHLHLLLGFFGVTAAYLPAVLVAGVLVLQAVLRRDAFRVRPGATLAMGGESVLWMLPLVAMNLLVGRAMLFSALGDNMMPRMLSAVGAGIYEEFIFRLVLVGMTVAVLTKVFTLKQPVVALCCVVVAATAFSLYHFVGVYQDGAMHLKLTQFGWFEFVYRMLAGVYLGWLYLFRGFGIAVGAHAAYDLYVELAPLLTVS